VVVGEISQGKITIDLEGSFLKSGEKITLENIEITNA